MKLKNIKIQGLFDLFDYDINLNQEGNLTILTGPNGYGKTTVLNIIYHLFGSRFSYFQKLVFSTIKFYFDNGYRLDLKRTELKNDEIEIVRKKKGLWPFATERERNLKSNYKISLSLYDQINKNIGSHEYIGYKGNQKRSRIDDYIPFVHRISATEWRDERTDRILEFDDLLNEFSEIIPLVVLEDFRKDGLNKNILDAFNSLKVYLIKEQRLIKPYKASNKYGERETSIVNTVQEFAEELSILIKNKQVESLQRTQELDSSFPKRLLDSKEILSKDEFDKRFESLKNKYEQLQKFGLITNTLDVPSYDDNKENTKVLSVYLSDSEEKIKVFDDLLRKIELFTNILNQKHFAFKSIQIDKARGFIFKTNKGQELALSELSSGEQHEVVLLYELLFKVQPNTLVLIDEPEISLHVSWQQEFVNDLIKIAEMQSIRFIVATHSPTIINNRFDLTVDLYDLTKKQS